MEGKKFINRKVLVTGAGSGIGAKIAEHFGTMGATLAIIDQNSEQLAVKKAELQAKGIRVFVYCADISNGEACQKAYDYFYSEIGFIDTLINNAGISPKHDGRALKVWELPTQEWEAVVNVNLNGTFNLIRLLVPEMMTHRFGKIINSSSVAGKAFLPIVACHYSATKAAIIGLTRHLAGELGPFNICVNAVAPGRIKTPMVMAVGDHVNAQFIADTPLGRLGSAEEVAEVIEFLASEQSSFVTGQVIDVAGGWLMR